MLEGVIWRGEVRMRCNPSIAQAEVLRTNIYYDNTLSW